MQEWALDEEGQLVLAGLLCLDVSEVRTFDPPRLMKCHGSGGSQQWSVGVSSSHTHTHTLNLHMHVVVQWDQEAGSSCLTGRGGLCLLLQKSERLYQVSVGQCLSVPQPVGPKGYVSMAICNAGAQQKWQLTG